MPHATGHNYKHIKVTPLAPTFAAEVSGIDFSQPVPDEVFQEILDAITTVSYISASYNLFHLASTCMFNNH